MSPLLVSGKFTETMSRLLISAALEFIIALLGHYCFENWKRGKAGLKQYVE